MLYKKRGSWSEGNCASYALRPLFARASFSSTDFIALYAPDKQSVSKGI